MKWWKQCSVDLEMQCFWPFGHSQLPAVCVWHLINVPQVGLLNTQAIMYGAAVKKVFNVLLTSLSHIHVLPTNWQWLLKNILAHNVNFLSQIKV